METIERLVRENDTCVLATAGEKEPHTSLMVYTFSRERGTLFLVTPRQTKKYANLTGNPNVSILIDTRCEDTPQSVRAMSICGIAHEIPDENARAAIRERFIEKRPDLEGFLDEPDTAFIGVSIQSVQILSGLRDADYTLFDRTDSKAFFSEDDAR